MEKMENVHFDYPFQVEKMVEKISNLVRDKTSPIVEFTPYFYHGDDGDVLALKVSKRRGIPCAVVRKELAEIMNRKYFIRTNNGVRVMDDRTLEWLFLHQEDPAYSPKLSDLCSIPS